MSLRASEILWCLLQAHLSPLLMWEDYKNCFVDVIVVFAADTVFCSSLVRRKSLSQETKRSCLWLLRTLRRFSALRTCTSASSSLCVLCSWRTETLHHRYTHTAPWHSDQNDINTPNPGTKELLNKIMKVWLYGYANSDIPTCKRLFQGGIPIISGAVVGFLWDLD